MSLSSIYGEYPTNFNRLKQRRSLDYGTHSFSLAGPTKYVPNNSSIPSSPSNSTTVQRPLISIRRQSSERCLQKRHSVDSNNSNISDPGFATSVNGKSPAGNIGLLPSSQQRSPRESASPKSLFSSVASVNAKHSAFTSMAVLTHQNSVNSKLLQKRQSSENLENRKWFSSSSVILTRVKSMKEKFRRVVVQSVQPDDWPPPSVLFSERYRYLSGSSGQSSNFNSSLRMNSVSKRGNPNLVKSKSIDQSSFSYSSWNPSKRPTRISNNGNIGGRQQRKLQRSMTSYSSSIEVTDQSCSSENGIICTNMDLKEIINNFKREEGLLNSGNVTGEDRKRTTQFISKTPTASSSSIGPGFGKRKLMRKQVSFDDEQGIMVINRKVSAIAEEIESHMLTEHIYNGEKKTKSKQSFDEKENSTEENVDRCVENYYEVDDENMTPDISNSTVPLLPKEVEFDEQGQTWEVYGADPDPEILGQAIQSHLERLMLCRQNLSLPNGNTPLTKSEEELPSVNRTNMSRILKPLRVDLQSSENNLRLIARRLCGSWSCFSHDRCRSRSASYTGVTQRAVSIEK